SLLIAVAHRRHSIACFDKRPASRAILVLSSSHSTTPELLAAHSMASNSTPYPSHAPVVLPSISEMFPEHLIPRSATTASPASASACPWSRFAPAPPPPPVTYPSFSFDVLKTDHRGSALEYIASSRPGPARCRPVVRTHPYNANSKAHSIPGSPDGDNEPEAIKEGECGDGESGAQEGKKHVCTKRNAFPLPPPFLWSRIQRQLEHAATLSEPRQLRVYVAA
ncbi:hypothetical protein B0H14DRAFT_3646967, partial [Mycena olivaceomarginata]